MGFNFAFFEGLSRPDAEAYQARFRELAEQALPTLRADAARHGIAADLSMDSIVPVYEWLLGQLSTRHLPSDPSDPEWIRSWEGYERNRFEFDEPSRVSILRAGYYLGETFVRAYPSLRWAIGRRRRAEQGQPAVHGFAHDMDMAVLLVATNTFRTLIADRSRQADIRRMVRTWRGLAER